MRTDNTRQVAAHDAELRDVDLLVVAAGRGEDRSGTGGGTAQLCTRRADNMGRDALNALDGRRRQHVERPGGAGDVCDGAGDLLGDVGVETGEVGIDARKLRDAREA